MEITKQKFQDSEFIINPDGSIFHLHLLPEDIADTIITVGDPERLNHVVIYFDKIELRKQNREFSTTTGYIGNKRITCISTGIGTDNIDIVLNELDALANINFKTRMLNEKIKSLDIIRMGTSGSIQDDIPVDSIVLSEAAIGMDGLMLFYKRIMNENEKIWEENLTHYFRQNHIDHLPLYYVEANQSLAEKFESFTIPGITLTNTGFYGPQGRILRYELRNKDYISLIQNYSFNGRRITNLEMETAGIYGMGKMLNHRCCALNAIIANRGKGEFSKQPQKTIDKLITLALEKIIS